MDYCFSYLILLPVDVSLLILFYSWYFKACYASLIFKLKEDAVVLMTHDLIIKYKNIDRERNKYKMRDSVRVITFS